MSEKVIEGRIMNVIEEEAEKLGLHSVYNVYDEPDGEFRPYLIQSGKCGSCCLARKQVQCCQIFYLFRKAPNLHFLRRNVLTFI